MKSHILNRFTVICVFVICLGFGVDQLRDGSLETYWQSDGPQPHLVNIQFRRKMTIQDIGIYADFKADESYTPNRYCIIYTLFDMCMWTKLSTKITNKILKKIKNFPIYLMGFFGA